MPHLLQGIREKIDRADEHIKKLDEEMAKFIADNYSIVSEPSKDGLEAIVSLVAQTADPPLRFSIIAGEIVHQLRSTLDHLVSQLFTEKNGGAPARRSHQFPICDSREAYESAVKRGNVKGLPATAVSLIEQAQPYRQVERGESADGNKFRILREMDDANKHRLFMMVIARTAPGAVELGIDGSQSHGEPINIIGLSPPKGPQRLTREGTEIYRVIFGEPQPHVRVTGKAPIQIAFGDCGPTLIVLGERPVIQAVRELRDGVAVFFNSFVNEF